MTDDQEEVQKLSGTGSACMVGLARADTEAIRYVVECLDDVGAYALDSLRRHHTVSADTEREIREVLRWIIGVLKLNVQLRRALEGHVRPSAGG